MGSRKNTRNTKDSQGKGKETDDIRRKVRLKRRKEEKKKNHKRGKVEWKRSHVPLLQHKSPEEADHGTSCRTGLLIKQSVHVHMHVHTHSVNWTPSTFCQVSVADGKTAQGIPMSKTNEWDHCAWTCRCLFFSMHDFGGWNVFNTQGYASGGFTVLNQGFLQLIIHMYVHHFHSYFARLTHLTHMAY